MLGKLLKYEFKASSKLFLLLYAALIAMSILNLCVDPLQNIPHENSVINALINIITGIFIFGYVVAIIAVAVVTIVVIIIRFYRNLMGDEGYLMFTLPVSADQQILSKLIVAMVWSMLSLILVFASILIVTARIDAFDAIGDMIRGLDSMGFNIGAWIIGLIITILLTIAGSILAFYAAMSVGPNLTRNRLLGSFLGYIIFYAISQLVGLLSIAVIWATGFLSEAESVELVTTQQVVDFSSSVGFGFFIYLNILNLILIAAYYLPSRYFLKNKLNLA